MTVIFNEKGRRMRTRVGDVKDTFTPANLEAIPEARFLARTLRQLGVLGIDPLADVERERIAEVLKQGKNWRPPGRKKT